MWKPSVAFRTDASVAIGTGHVMRCLTLADALTKRGAACAFVCRHLPPSLADVITARGHGLHRLPPAAPGFDDLAHSPWLGTTMAADAADCAPVLAGLNPDWLVVDHYALDARWTRALRGALPHMRVLAIDDLADRVLECDLLVDSTAGRCAGDYDGLVRDGAPRLTGPMFAPLRPEFAALRPAALARRGGQLRRILVTMGGVDAENATGRVLAALEGLDLAVTVVMGGSAPHLDAVRAQVATMAGARLVVDSPDMATLMGQADLAIGAAGSTAWERCALGLPALLLVLADNQRMVAAGLEQAGAAHVLGEGVAADWPSHLPRLLAQIDLARMSAAAAALTDGAGAGRIVAMLSALPRLHLRPATPADAQRVWQWRHEGDATRHYRTPVPTPLDAHLRWFDAALTDPQRDLFIVERDGEPQAHVRLDHSPPRAEVALTVSAQARGQGLAAPALALAFARTQRVATFDAEAHEGNTPSRRLFEGLGFRCIGTASPFVRYRLDWSRP
jgi:UDP-2,4-diacetamido-2,4,6-trideoxy-beta-L-altropyranose hydrolase